MVGAAGHRFLEPGLAQIGLADAAFGRDPVGAGEDPVGSCAAELPAAGLLGGAALDAFAHEPPLPDGPLRGAPNVSAWRGGRARPLGDRRRAGSSSRPSAAARGS